MKPFNNGILDPSDPIGNAMMTQEYHIEPPFTGYHILTRDGTYFQLIKQDAARDKQCVSTMPYCRKSSPTDVIMCYQSITIHSTTHVIYVYPYYYFRPEENYYKLFSD